MAVAGTLLGAGNAWVAIAGNLLGAGGVSVAVSFRGW